MAVEQHAHAALTAVAADCRHADAISRIENTVTAYRQAGGTAEAGLHQPPLAAVVENLGHAAIDEMRHEQMVVGGKSKIVDAGPDCRNYCLAPTLQIEAKNLARAPLS